jgi:hypothetical protein
MARSAGAGDDDGAERSSKCSREQLPAASTDLIAAGRRFFNTPRTGLINGRGPARPNVPSLCSQSPDFSPIALVISTG